MHVPSGGVVSGFRRGLQWWAWAAVAGKGCNGMADVVEVVVSSCEGLRQEVWAGRHTLTADEPEALGGADAGPDPYQLLLAALGSCTSITMRMYAERRQWPLEHVEVRLRHCRVHAKDCAECEQKEGFLDRIEKEIVLGGPLSDDQVQRLGEIAEKCPVNRTLRGAVQTVQSIRRAPES